MTTVPRELSSVCRFCLSQDEKNLLLLGKTLSASLTVEDVQRFSGITIILEDTLSCAICLECLGSLNQSADFRNACIGNDATFRQLLSAVRSSISENSVHPAKGANPLDVKIEVLEHGLVKTEPDSEDTFDDSGHDLKTAASQDIANEAVLPERETIFNANVSLGGDDDDCGSDSNELLDDDNQNLTPKKRTRKGRVIKKPRNFDDDGVKEKRNQKVAPKKRNRPGRPSKQPRACDDEGRHENDSEKLAPKKRIRRVTKAKDGDSDGEANENDRNESLPADNRNLAPKKRIRIRKPRTVAEEDKTSEGGICPRVLCTICGKLVTNMSFHKVEHEENPTKYPCPHCPVMLKHKTYLKEHINTIHLKIMVKTCEICGRAFGSKRLFKSHMESVHYSGEPLECNFCSKVFKNPINLKAHLYLIHSGKRYTCDVCETSFKSTTLLNKHKRVHSDDRPFACGKCPKRFKSHYARTTHEWTHSGILFRCTLCDRSYRYRTFLNAHMRKMHGSEIPPNEEETATDTLN